MHVNRKWDASLSISDGIASKIAIDSLVCVIRGRSSWFLGFYVGLGFGSVSEYGSGFWVWVWSRT